jgi:hypothetical protein
MMLLYRVSYLFILLLLLIFEDSSLAQIHFQVATRQVIETRLRGFSSNNRQREATLKRMFAGVGCGDHLSEQPVRHVKEPNLICVLPGADDSAIVVGAHLEHVEWGEGVVDNWSGSSLLPSLYENLHASPTKHTFIFIAFTAEELGLIGSRAYVHEMKPDEVRRTRAMVNLDSLGLSDTKVWLSHSDKQLAGALYAVATAMKLPISAVNVDNVGSTDSESFWARGIPRITIHSVTQETFPILHTRQDRLSAIKFDDYYNTYRLLAAYLTYIDGTLGQTEQSARNPTKTN